MAVKRGDFYSFEYLCSLSIYDEKWGMQDYHTNITVEAIWDDAKKMYEVDFYVENTPELDFQNDYDCFKQVEVQFLSDLANEGVGKSSLIYP